MKKNPRKTILVLIISNIIFLIISSVLLLNKMGILTKATIRKSEISYLSNPHYKANLSMFKLNKRDTDVAFAGDSITAFGRFNEFFPEIKLINRGIGGDTTEGLYYRIDEVLSHHPKKIFIMIGINDLINGIPQDESMYYYKSILIEIKRNMPNCNIYVESVLPIVNIDLHKIEEFNCGLQEICREEEVEYIDIYSYFICEECNLNDLLSQDGIHLNGAGYKLLTEHLKPKITQ